MKEDAKKSLWAVTLEYFLAAPILGIPCYMTVPVWADTGGIVFGGMILVGVFYVSLAVYQLKRTHIPGTDDRIKLYAAAGAICGILSLLSILFFLRYAPSVPADYVSVGTGSPSWARGMITIISSMAFGFLAGFAALFWGYGWLNFVASTRSRDDGEVI